ncbi:MAG: B12-binding domain-containing radical SAM protein, partial [Nitrospirae bacterium]|nr:B12-binding domain-containing radical SAM protein [Nitrospirota bacterium]
MKILLIQPPPRHIAKEDIIVPPLGIAYLASVLEGKGCKVSIIDAFAEMMDIN